MKFNKKIFTISMLSIVGTSSIIAPISYFATTFKNNKFSSNSLTKKINKPQLIVNDSFDLKSVETKTNIKNYFFRVFNFMNEENLPKINYFIKTYSSSEQSTKKNRDLAQILELVKNHLIDSFLNSEEFNNLGLLNNSNLIAQKIEYYILNLVNYIGQYFAESINFNFEFVNSMFDKTISYDSYLNMNNLFVELFNPKKSIDLNKTMVSSLNKDNVAIQKMIKESNINGNNFDTDELNTMSTMGFIIDFQDYTENFKTYQFSAFNYFFPEIKYDKYVANNDYEEAVELLINNEQYNVSGKYITFNDIENTINKIWNKLLSKLDDTSIGKTFKKMINNYFKKMINDKVVSKLDKQWPNWRNDLTSIINNSIDQIINELKNVVVYLKNLPNKLLTYYWKLFFNNKENYDFIQKSLFENKNSIYALSSIVKKFICFFMNAEKLVPNTPFYKLDSFINKISNLFATNKYLSKYDNLGVWFKTFLENSINNILNEQLPNVLNDILKKLSKNNQVNYIKLNFFIDLFANIFSKFGTIKPHINEILNLYPKEEWVRIMKNLPDIIKQSNKLNDIFSDGKSFTLDKLNIFINCIRRIYIDIFYEVDPNNPNKHPYLPSPASLIAKFYELRLGELGKQLKSIYSEVVKIKSNYDFEDSNLNKILNLFNKTSNIISIIGNDVIDYLYVFFANPYTNNILRYSTNIILSLLNGQSDIGNTAQLVAIISTSSLFELSFGSIFHIFDGPSTLIDYLIRNKVPVSKWLHDHFVYCGEDVWGMIPNFSIFDEIAEAFIWFGVKIDIFNFWHSCIKVLVQNKSEQKKWIEDDQW